MKQEYIDIELTYLSTVYGGTDLAFEEKTRVFKFIKMHRQDTRCKEIIFKMMNLYEHAKTEDGNVKFVANVSILIPIIETVINTLMVCDTPADELEKKSLLMDNIALAKFAEIYLQRELNDFFLILRGLLKNQSRAEATKLES